MPSEQEDRRWMGRALALAARGRTSPNPQVGAVIVSPEGALLGEGYHRRCGGPHAEVEALRDAGDAARGAHLYVTLEPCNHRGRTPPCTEAVLAAGIRRVVIGALDPDLDVAGGGAERLRAEGLEVVVGVEADRCLELIEAFTVHRRLRRPQVLLKAAMTLDGKIATRTGHSAWVTGPAARRAVHRVRHRVDAIMVGVGTVLADDPQLTTRLPRGVGHDPIRVIVDSRARTPRAAKVIDHGSASPTLIAHTAEGQAAAAALVEGRPLVEAICCESRGGRVDLGDLLRRLAARGIVALLVEGGGELHGSLLEAGLADRVMFFVAPKIAGGRQAVPAVGGTGVARMDQAAPLEGMRVRRLGPDLLIEGKLASPPAERG